LWKGTEAMLREDEVRQASEQYYAALSSLLSGDAGPLMQIWSEKPDVTAMNPYGDREEGWEQLQPVFERVAAMCAGSQARVWLEDQRLQVGTDLAYESGIESGEGILMGKPTTIRHRVTNIYRREADGWKMVHRHTDLNPAEHDVAEQLHPSQGEALPASATASTASQPPVLSAQEGAQEQEMSQHAVSVARKREIDALTGAFFSAVSFREGDKPDYQQLYELFIESGQLIRMSSAVPEISSVSQFIEPRQRMVGAGELTCFQEVETAEITELFGNVAHRFSTYEKSGINQGTVVKGRGTISMQYILTDAGWKISSMAWDDERPGLFLPDRYRATASDDGRGPEDASSSL
jgi:ketosteroid isomerase-like protein